MTDQRRPRDTETRASEERTQLWRRPDTLPTPADDGKQYHYRWIRTSTFGQTDPTNVSSRFREGYVPVLAKDHPEMKVIADHESRFPENIEVGGLLLCKIDKRVADDRVRQQGELAKRQMEAVDNNYLRQSDPRMPVLKPERSTRTSFGEG